ncbi:MAG: DUF4837 family protein, partial [Bacteroidales bacterium]|nr:DUF4837 family protein [Bacteroidales bacterium]
ELSYFKMNKTMNKRLFYTLLLIVLVLFSSCKHKLTKEDALTKGMPSSGGKTLEMLLIIPDSLYNKTMRDFVGNIFEKAQEGLPQKEPYFDLVQLTPAQYYNSEMFKKHRNVLIIEKKAGNNNTIKQAINKGVYPQAIFEIKVDNIDSIYSILNSYAETIKYQYRKNEHIRIYNAFKRDENIKLTEVISNKFNFSLTFSSDYYLAKQTDNFLWIRKETQKESFNIMMYKKKYTSDDLLLEKKVIELRDSLGKAFIPASMPNSYMGTEIRENISKLYRDTVKVGDYAMIETRGLWRSFGDFMGGAFVNYCFKNPATNELVMIDCFLYNPNKNKRDYLMQLESIVYSIEKTKKK